MKRLLIATDLSPRAELALARACPDQALSAAMLARSRQALKRRTGLEQAA